MCWRLLFLLAALSSYPAAAEVYAYVNDQGDYVVSPKSPGKRVAEYAVLTDDGEFLRLVRPRDDDVPITHWRPWFLPKEPDPFDADEEAIYREREGVVGVEEVMPEAPEHAVDEPPPETDER